jgi:hypothetical protein
VAAINFLGRKTYFTVKGNKFVTDKRKRRIRADDLASLDDGIFALIERGVLPPDYQIPEHVKAFAEALRGPARHEVMASCAFIRAVALRRPQ